MRKHIVTGPVAVAEFAGGASRYLYKGAILPEGCTNLAHLKAVGLVAETAEPVAETAEPEPEPELAVETKDFDDMKLDELKAHAAENGIDLGDARTKADIMAAIQATRGE